jgi:hypothetical protein
MKRHITLGDKTKLFIKWMRGHADYGLLAACSCCNSTRIKRTGSREDDVFKGVRSYNATYECMDCRATATCTETWTSAVPVQEIGSKNE